MDNIRDITRLVDRYFAALHAGDVAEIGRIFLPECDLIQAKGEGDYAHMTLPAYLEVVAGRPSPEAAGHPVFGELLSIDLNGPDLAVVTLNSAVQPRFFCDFLTLIRTADGWRIASKIYRLLRVGDGG